MSSSFNRFPYKRAAVSGITEFVPSAYSDWLLPSVKSKILHDQGLLMNYAWNGHRQPVILSWYGMMFADGLSPILSKILLSSEWDHIYTGTLKT